MLMEKKLDFEINTSVGDFSTDCEFCDTARPMPAVEKIFDAQIKIQRRDKISQLLHLQLGI